MSQKSRPIPTGICWCGCGNVVGKNSFFEQWHDKFAEGHVTKQVYGSVANYLHEHG